MPLRSGKLGSADYYLIRAKPSGNHKSFRILRQVILPTGKTSSQTISDPRLDAINAAFLAPNSEVRISAEAADKAVMDLLKQLYIERDQHKPITVFHSDNVALFESYWKTVYGNKPLKDPKSTRADFNRAIRALGNINLLTAPLAEVQTALEIEAGLRVTVSEDAPKRAQRTKEQERQAKKAYADLAGRINQLLRSLGREEKDLLVRGAIPRPLITWVSYPEFEKLLIEIQDPDMQTLMKVAFGSGMRAGECFAYDTEDVQRAGARIYVEEQLKYRTVKESEESGQPRFYRDEIKNKKNHHTLVLPFARQAVMDWLDVPEAKREKLRVDRLAEIISAAAKKLWPDKPIKHIGFHDLRHCYAVHCLSTLGFNLTTVSTFMGDNFQTVEWYYGGFVMTDEGFERCETVAQAYEAKKTPS